MVSTSRATCPTDCGLISVASSCNHLIALRFRSASAAHSTTADPEIALGRTGARAIFACRIVHGHPARAPASIAYCTGMRPSSTGANGAPATRCVPLPPACQSSSPSRDVFGLSRAESAFDLDPQVFAFRCTNVACYHCRPVSRYPGGTERAMILVGESPHTTVMRGSSPLLGPITLQCPSVAGRKVALPRTRERWRPRLDLRARDRVAYSLSQPYGRIWSGSPRSSPRARACYDELQALKGLRSVHL